MIDSVHDDAYLFTDVLLKRYFPGPSLGIDGEILFIVGRGTDKPDFGG
jgi:hypothetical protein